jgi:hypothetical protein
LHTVRQWAGMGTSLVAEVARLATGLGCARYWVVTTNHNIGALRFYRRRGSGWRRCGVAPSMPRAEACKEVCPLPVT